MDTRKKLLLLPYGFQVAGWIIAGFSAILFLYGILFIDKPYIQNDPAVYGIGLFLIGLFIIGFSREKQEDEFTIFLRTRSALTAVIIMFGLKLLFLIIIAALSGAASFSETVHDNVFNSQSFADLFMGFHKDANFGSAFMLYLILYKIRLDIYKRGARDEE